MPTSLKITLGSHSFSQRSGSRYAAGHGGQARLGRRQHLPRTLGGVQRPETHRHCPGRWRGVVSLKPGPDGQRRRKKVSGKNKTEVRAKLAELHDELNEGVVTNASCTVAHAIEDWLADGLAGRVPKTVSTQREVLEPLIDIIGAVPLRELSAANVRSALKDLAATRATRTVAMTHAGLTRAIRHAEANDKVGRTPTGKRSRHPRGTAGPAGRHRPVRVCSARLHAVRPPDPLQECHLVPPPAGARPGGLRHGGPAHDSGARGYLRADTDWCGTCFRPRQSKHPARVCVGCGQGKRHEALGLCSACWQRRPEWPSSREPTWPPGSPTGRACWMASSGT
jgi:hypothetical protein